MAHVEIIRRAYLQKLREMMEQRDTIKIITGSRYSGKSYLLCQFRERLVSMGIPEGDIIFVPLEDRQAEISNAVQLESYVKASAPQSGGFLLIDDIQMIPDVGAALCRLRDCAACATAASASTPSSLMPPPTRGRRRSHRSARPRSSTFSRSPSRSSSMPILYRTSTATGSVSSSTSCWAGPLSSISMPIPRIRSSCSRGSST